MPADTPPNLAPRATRVESHRPDVGAGPGGAHAHPGEGPEVEDPARLRAIHPDGMQDHDFERRVKRIESFAHLMDTSIALPVVGWRVGLDGLIGLIPGVGDTVTTAASTWLVAEGWRLGARKRVMGRMLVNLGIDWVIGLVPLIGDILDIGYKANAKNARMLVEELRTRRRAAREMPIRPPERRTA
ncbi:MAG: DUF4112 domain-containing protein [Paracoccaceae bacterium]